MNALIRCRTRARFILPLLIGLSALAGWAGIEQLGRERDRLAAAELMVEMGSRPAAPLVPPGMAFTERDRRAAVARFTVQLRRAAANHRLLIERLEPMSESPDRLALLRARIFVSGSEGDIRNFTRLVESGKPAIRFAAWRLARAGSDDASVRIEALAFALWEGGK